MDKVINNILSMSVENKNHHQNQYLIRVIYEFLKTTTIKFFFNGMSLFSFMINTSESSFRHPYRIYENWTIQSKSVLDFLSLEAILFTLSVHFFNFRSFVRRRFFQNTEKSVLCFWVHVNRLDLPSFPDADSCVNEGWVLFSFKFSVPLAAVTSS